MPSDRPAPAAAPRASLLIFLATYNEVDNVGLIHALIRDYCPEADILFVDDNSPDGTGAKLDSIAAADPRVHVVHRPGKQGIGSAHKVGIAWAYDHGYARLVTMDCDLAHSPEYLPVFLATEGDVVVGSRFASRESLPGWTLYRKTLTRLGHALTQRLLDMPYDATGAFRCYDLRRVPRAFLSRVRSDSYPFFFESLHLLHRNGLTVTEVPIHLPARTYGESKMRLRDVARGAGFLVGHALRARLRPGTLRLGDDGLPMNTPGAWDGYWAAKRRGGDTAGRLYERVAALYRRLLIKPTLDAALARSFPDGARLLHAGCGSGMVDRDVARRYRLTACDFSPLALACHAAEVGEAATRVQGDLFRLPFDDGTFDGVYNLGVMEHFQATDLGAVLAELGRVLTPSGRLVLFWPHRRAPSVLVLTLIHAVLNDVLGRDVHLHPAEPSLLASREDAARHLAAAGLVLDSYTYGWRDLFTQAVVVARPPGP